MDEIALQQAQAALDHKRREHHQQIQPVKLPTVTIHQNEAEKEYWLALANGDDTGAPREVIQARRDLWDSFSAERYPKLEAAVKTIKRWYNDYLESGGGIILAGGCGSGKTHLARAIGQLYGPGAKYWNECDLIGTIQDTYNGSGSELRIFKEAAGVRLLIYDDLGVYRATERNIEWLQGIYYNLFNTRCENRKPFLLTTNLDDANGELETRLGQRVYSRVAGALGSSQFYIDMFGVPDYRLRNF